MLRLLRCTSRTFMPEPKSVRLRRLFAAALDRPAALRTDFLASASDGDIELQRRVLAMLAAAEDRALPAERPGTRLGIYKLLQQIGDGESAVVFLAEQEQAMPARVAVKVLRPGIDAGSVLTRFEAQRSALAKLDHPNLARVLDAGATAAGSTYFVMELVKGAPIVAYCERFQLSIDERLELFAQVCDAVQHAHRAGVVHRDLRPANILVGTRDGRPQAKVVDLGIAEATSQPASVDAARYRSPEQRSGTLEIDARTDVHSLGVLLDELLCGDTTVAAEIPQRERLRGRELGWIVQRATANDRADRYRSAGELALDVARCVAGDVVLAAPTSVRYRLRKLVRRHRGRITIAALVAMVGAVVAWQAGAWRD